MPESGNEQDTNANVENSGVTNDSADDLRSRLANNIIAYRKIKKISRIELATRIGVSDAVIGQYERRERMPPIEILCRLSDVIGRPIDSLLGHGSQNFDVVAEYRLKQACDIVKHWGYDVEESEKSIRLVKKERTSPSFTVSNGEVSLQTTKGLFDSLSFDTHEAFILFVDSLILCFISSINADIIFDETVMRLTGNEPFLPKLKVEVVSDKFSGFVYPF